MYFTLVTYNESAVKLCKTNVRFKMANKYLRKMRKYVHQLPLRTRKQSKMLTNKYLNFQFLGMNCLFFISYFTERFFEKVKKNNCEKASMQNPPVLQVFSSFVSGTCSEFNWKRVNKRYFSNWKIEKRTFLGSLTITCCQIIHKRNG